MFDTYEKSRRGGKPTHLFVFGRQAVAWRYAACDRDVTIGGIVYTAAAIERGEIKQTVEPAQDKLTITLPYARNPGAELPATQSLGDNWHPYVPTDHISVMCLSVHLNDPDLQANVDWLGQVGQPKFTDGQLELTCVPDSGPDRARAMGAKWQRACWKTVYSTGLRGCNLDRSKFETVATLTAVNGLQLTAAEFNGLALSLAGGSLEYTRPDGVLEHLSIMTHTGDTIGVLQAASGLAVGLQVTVYPGCEHTWQACLARANTDNYGGAIYEPVANPYDGASMSWQA